MQLFRRRRAARLLKRLAIDERDGCGARRQESERRRKNRAIKSTNLLADRRALDDREHLSNTTSDQAKRRLAHRSSRQYGDTGLQKSPKHEISINHPHRASGWQLF